MKNNKSWDWQTPEKKIPVQEWEDRFNWVQTLCVSPDGEKIAAIVNTDEMEFDVCVNGETWGDPVEKAWALQFTPGGQLAVLASRDEEWGVGVDGEFWENWFDYAWNLQSTPDGSHIAVTVQKEMEYGMAVNGKTWDHLYQNISGMVLSPQGTTAAVVQVKPLGQADIEGFAAGIFSAALDGKITSDIYMNVRDICFSPQGDAIAYGVRRNRLDYSISGPDAPWQKTFQYTWTPGFADDGKSVIAPVRIGGKWHLFKEDSDFWGRPYEQLWNLEVHNPTGKIAAVVSQKFGKWGICIDGETLDFECDTMISDMQFSEDGSKMAAVYKDHGTWDITVNGQRWHLNADKLWRPVFSPKGDILATRMEKNGRYHLIVNGRVYNTSFDMVFAPQISPDNSHILLKTLSGGIYTRQVLPLDQII